MRIATEGALLGTLIACGYPPDLVIISDDAGQFNVLAHALCRVHADRVFQRIVPLNDRHALYRAPDCTGLLRSYVGHP